MQIAGSAEADKERLKSNEPAVVLHRNIDHILSEPKVLMTLLRDSIANHQIVVVGGEEYVIGHDWGNYIVIPENFEDDELPNENAQQIETIAPEEGKVKSKGKGKGKGKTSENARQISEESEDLAEDVPRDPLNPQTPVILGEEESSATASEDGKAKNKGKGKGKGKSSEKARQNSATQEKKVQTNLLKLRKQ